MHIPKIRITYNEACELLSVNRDGLRLIIKKDPSFPRPIKYGSHRQSPVYFDYVDLLEWHNAQKANATLEA